MKKLLLILVSMMMIASLISGCQKKQEQQTEVNEPVEEEPVKEETKPVLGGWTVNNDIVNTVIPDDAKQAFVKAAADYKEVELLPVVLLASQVVSGTNYSFLAKASDGQWYVAIVYADLQGNASITSAQPIDINAIKTTDKQPENILGGWKAAEVSNAVTLPEEVWAKFNEAMQGFVGVNLSPLALLASQVVSGTNYLILCAGNTVTANPVEGLYVATLYVDTQGNAKLSNVELFDVMAYSNN